MQHKLFSENIIVTINSQGAEVVSVKNKNEIEFMWQGQKEIWARHAPVLFPIVGKLKDNEFEYKERLYSLPQHGFARDMEFSLIHSEPSSCTYRLNSSEETKNKFPFDFVFEISYLLQHNSLTTTYKVANHSAHMLYFSVGAHPGFNCPLSENESFEDYFIEFEKNSITQTLLDKGLLSDKKKTLQLHNGILPITKTLFDADALIFENKQISRISLCSKKTNHKISMECKDWPYFGIWSKKSCEQFICLEPWHGITDPIHTNKSLVGKKGILALEQDKTFNCSFSMTFH